jgi:flagellar hook assembly protein FlgD
MVQFQTLDAMTSMQKAITQLAQVSDLANASAMIGKTVTATAQQTPDPETGFPRPDQVVTGKVSSVVFGSSGAMLSLDSNISVPVSKVVIVE